MEYRIWDPVVRICHWGIAALFLLDFWVLEGGEDAHEYVGYLLAALLAVRIVWGFVGPFNARFTSFFPTRARLRAWFYSPETRYPADGGHNALGAVMVLFMFVLLAVVSVSGWLQETDRFWGEDWVQLLHEWSANVLMAAVVVHVIAIIFIQRKTGISLIWAMISGRRQS